MNTKKEMSIAVIFLAAAIVFVSINSYSQTMFLHKAMMDKAIQVASTKNS
jgi:hypothetical protein